MDCIFCKIASGEIPSSKIYEDDKVFAFLDISPQSKGHTLVIPKQHFGTIYDIPEDVLVDLIKVVKNISHDIKDRLGCGGLNIKQNNGELAGQTVHHLHFHLIPRYKQEEYEIEDILATLKKV
jgi:histidine triad (HIT) family protein